MFFEGFLFGLIGQLTIGPVCLYIINTAISMGFFAAFISVLGVTIADGIYILLALAGVSGLIRNTRLQAVFKAAGGIVLLLFGLDIILGASGLGILTNAQGPGQSVGKAGYFLYAFLLTISNPITIIFWAGIFTAKIAVKMQDKTGLYMFGAGAAVSTVVFLTAVSAVGAGFHFYLPLFAIKTLNIAAGAAIIIYGLLLFRPNIKTHTRG